MHGELKLNTSQELQNSHTLSSNNDKIFAKLNELQRNTQSQKDTILSDIKQFRVQAACKGIVLPDRSGKSGLM